MSKRMFIMMLAGGLAIGAESSAVGAGNACAPDESAATAEFFAKYVDCSIPALREIPAKMAAGDAAAAKRLFADYIRATLDPRWFEANGQEASLTKEGKANLKRQAEAIMDYRVSACGVPYHFKDHKIDWMSNPTYNNYREWPWQLGRQPFFTTLAKYYVRMGQDEKAAETWRDMVDSWIAQAGTCPEDSPPGRPVMWRTLDTGLRVAGWCRQICAFAKSPALSDDFIVRFFRSVRAQGHRLEKPLTSNNWRIMELNGLLHIAIYFPFLTESAAWQASAIKEYETQLDLQLYPDGFHFELSPGYHSVIPGDYGRILALFRLRGLPPPPFVLKGIEKAYDMYPHLSRPDRYLPAVNDSGLVSLVGQMKSAIRLYPDRADFRWFATEGSEGHAPDYLSYVFPYAGAVVFRSSWAKDAVWCYMDCSPFGRGHQHEDKLNVLISAYGKNMVVEPGNYAYDGSEMRKYVLSTRAHNTILVDGLEQRTRRGWKWHPEDIRKKADLVARLTPSVDWARASYTNGYYRDKGKIVPVVHERTTFFFKQVKDLAPFFVCVDRLTSSDTGAHTYDSQWHLETSELKIAGAGFTADFGAGIGLAAAFSDADAKIVDMKGTHKPYQGWMPISPPGPHEHRPIPTPVLKGTFTGAKRVVSVFYPYRDGANRVAGVQASADPAATAFTLMLTDGTTVVLDEKCDK